MTEAPKMNESASPIYSKLSELVVTLDSLSMNPQSKNIGNPNYQEFKEHALKEREEIKRLVGAHSLLKLGDREYYSHTEGNQATLELIIHFPKNNRKTTVKFISDSKTDQLTKLTVLDIFYPLNPDEKMVKEFEVDFLTDTITKPDPLEKPVPETKPARDLFKR